MMRQYGREYVLDIAPKAYPQQQQQPASSDQLDIQAIGFPEFKAHIDQRVKRTQEAFRWVGGVAGVKVPRF